MLAEVGILGRRKEGTFVYYRIVDEGVFALCDAGLRLGAAAAARAERARRGSRAVTVVAAPLRAAAPAQQVAVGPLGRLGRWTADHVRIVAIAWAIVAVALGVFAPKVETALSGAGWQANGSESVQARDADPGELRRACPARR